MWHLGDSIFALLMVSKEHFIYTPIHHLGLLRLCFIKFWPGAFAQQGFIFCSAGPQKGLCYIDPSIWSCHIMKISNHFVSLRYLGLRVSFPTYGGFPGLPIPDINGNWQWCSNSSYFWMKEFVPSKYRSLHLQCCDTCFLGWHSQILFCSCSTAISPLSAVTESRYLGHYTTLYVIGV
jgi:hypothetical protein